MGDGPHSVVPRTARRGPSSGVRARRYGGRNAGSGTAVLSPVAAMTRGFGDWAAAMGAPMRSVRSTSAPLDI